MIAFGLFYSFSLVALGLAADRRLRYGGPLLLSLTAVLANYSQWSFGLVAVGYVLLTAWMAERPLARPWQWSRYGVWFIVSALLVTHSVPGYQGLQLTEAIVLKPGSLPTALYLNHDKVWVAWSLLCFLPLFRRSDAGIPRLANRHLTWPVLGFVATLALALTLGLIDWQPGIPPFFWVFALSNLVNTCVAEELLFRGVVQRRLMQLWSPLGGLLAASVLFGLAHFAGGWGYVAVATVAGLVYGLAYWLGGRLVWAVLVHWGLNLTHLLLFTYPMSLS